MSISIDNSKLNNKSNNLKDMIIKEEAIIDRSIHFLIPALSADEPSHILSLPETFAIQQNPLEIPLPSGKYILAPSPSELFHYYESVQPQMNNIISSSEGIIEHLTSENFIHIVENLSEYSIPCPVLQNPITPSVDKSTSMISIDQSYISQYPNDFDKIKSNTEYYFHRSPSYDNCYMDSISDYSSTINDDPNLFIHNEQLISKYYSSNPSYLNNNSSNCNWTSLPICHEIISSSNNTNWKKVRSNGNHNKKIKIRNSRKRTKFSNDDLEILNLFFDKNPMPSRSDISILSEKLAYPRYIVQVWFYNKRQSLKRANSSSQMENITSRIIK